MILLENISYTDCQTIIILVRYRIASEDIKMVPQSDTDSWSKNSMAVRGLLAEAFTAHLVKGYTGAETDKRFDERRLYVNKIVDTRNKRD